MPEQLLNERDHTSHVFNGRLIDWKNFEVYLAGFVCRCAEAAFNKGYRVIGIQFYGECWSGPEAHLDYEIYGESRTCVNHEFKKIANRTACNIGTGTDSTNYVYRIAPTSCNTYYEPVGCFHDSMIEPRPLPDYLQNERDFSISNWNGILIDWKNWNTYSPEMICRCADFAKKRGHSMFAIQFWGECWSGAGTSLTFHRDGPSKNCRAENFDTCPCNSYHCVGMAKTNHVYKLIEGPGL